jgi:hypothetical protein
MLNREVGAKQEGKLKLEKQATNPFWEHTMKINYTIAAAIILAGLSQTASSAAFYTQNFDSMGLAGTTAPPGWSSYYLGGDGVSSTLPTSGDMVGALAGSTALQVWNQPSAAATWGSGVIANEGASNIDPNRLLGTSPTGDMGDILQLSLNNSSGAPITALQVTYDMKTMAPGLLKAGFDPGAIDELPGYAFYYLDGTTWTHVSSLDLSSDGTASATFYYSTHVANGGTMQFRWYDDNAYAYSPDTMYAIDNVNINNVPEPAMLSLLAVGAGLALISRRRKA